MCGNQYPCDPCYTLSVGCFFLPALFVSYRDKKNLNEWCSRSLEGISVRSMLVNLFFQSVIFLYLADNDTTYMILVTNAIGLVIEV